MEGGKWGAGVTACVTRLAEKRDFRAGVSHAAGVGAAPQVLGEACRGPRPASVSRPCTLGIVA